MKPRAARSKIQSPAALARKLARRKGKVVFTNGCFDLVHRGHVAYLEKARALGAALIVALNSDASVRRLKGRGRPVTQLADRQAVLAALECVDYVTSFADSTPLRLIRKLRPDLVVKGGDYRPGARPGDAKYIVGAREVQSWGGRVRAIPFVKGRSTTGLLGKLRKL
jgi:rfaE bifunctional protein nucleotidyltransferase chain/domain